MRLQLHTEIAAIVEHTCMDRRDPRSAGVEILPGPELAALRRQMVMLEHAAAPHRPDAPAGPLTRLQHRYRIARLLELMGRHKP